MRIVINTSGSIAGGAITHLRNLLPRLLRQRGSDSIVAIGTGSLRDVLEPPETLPWTEVDIDFRSLRRRFMWENMRLPGLLRELGADVLFHPSNVAVYRAPVPQVNLVHNLAPFLPEIVAEERAYQKFRLGLLRYLTVDSLRRADRTIFVSEWGKKRVLEAAPGASDPGPVVYFGADHADLAPDACVLARWGLASRRYVLCVSHFYRYKKLERLLEAYATLGGTSFSLPLVLVGHAYDAAYAEHLRAMAERADGPVIFTGALDAASVATLMHECLVFAFPSSVENLPITLLEAMAAGAPVITSRACSMPEVCGDAALYADPPTADGYARALRRIVGQQQLRDELANRARDRAARFSWDHATNETLRVLRDAAS